MSKLITSENYEAEIASKQGSIIVKFFAPWCGSCQKMAPIFKEIAQELADTYSFAEINIDQNKELAQKHDVTSIPTFIFIKDGEVKGKEVGAMNKEDLIAKIKHYLE